LSATTEMFTVGGIREPTTFYSMIELIDCGSRASNC